MLTKKYKIALKTIDDVRVFVNEMNKLKGSVTVNSEKYSVDGKSILGIMSLNLTKPLTVEVNYDKDDNMQRCEIILNNWKA